MPSTPNTKPDNMMTYIFCVLIAILAIGAPSFVKQALAQHDQRDISDGQQQEIEELKTQVTELTGRLDRIEPLVGTVISTTAASPEFSMVELAPHVYLQYDTADNSGEPSALLVFGNCHPPMDMYDEGITYFVGGGTEGSGTLAPGWEALAKSLLDSKKVPSVFINSVGLRADFSQTFAVPPEDIASMARKAREFLDTLDNEEKCS